ncbi:VPLPA-CTERM-specific exosortase XrtD [Yoonia sp. R2331]|uniref:VPLPA-CTERM-specific exosortase XrtD n=1 Tax=Yoonia sp. R2331 TaxID=3237238 RepID=UPI0034E515BE
MIVVCAAAGVFFWDGIGALLEAWQLPEYSHGPLIPVLSGLLFLRQLKEFPERPGPIRDRWIGVTVILAAIAMGSLGKLSNINDIVAYALILWIGGLLLVSFGWKTGKHFWPPVLHLVYMLPLPGVIYYKTTTWLQFISSELGVWFLKLMSVPVFLDGNIIDLGVTKLHVAEACSGLRYLFPILSFSYIFAVLYRGQMWHKAVLLISAVPITILMNSVRIAVAGYIVNNWGLAWVEGFSHFFEGWVIFVACILILFLLARILLYFNPVKMSLIEALDLDTDGLGTQAMRLRHVMPSAAMITSAGAILAAVAVFAALPERGAIRVDRESFSTFPRTLGSWEQTGPRRVLDASVATVLGADDYHQVQFTSPNAAASVNFFSAWYYDQSSGGVHSPEICLPGGGWEIAWLERTDVTEQLGSAEPYNINRAIIQKGETRMMVYYWFEQKGRHIAWDFSAKLWLMIDGVRTGRTDGALVRLTTPILPNETDADAEARLNDVLVQVQAPLGRFIPAQ